MEPNNDNPLLSAMPASHSLQDAGALPASGAGGVTPPAISTAQPSAPQQASDAELIEDEWIDATRRAIGSNSGDPHAMSDAVAALRKEYLAQRYGKSLKTE